MSAYCCATFPSFSLMPRLFQLSTGLRQVLRNAGWIMGEQVIRMLAGMFVGIWIARHLGPSDYGLLNYSQALTGLLAVVAALGFNRMVVRELVEHQGKPDRQAAIVTTVFAFRFTSAVILYLSAISLSGLTQNDHHTLVVTLVGISIVASPFDCVDHYFQSQSRSRIAALARSSAFFLTTGVKLAMLMADAGLQAFAAAIALEYAMNAVSLFWAYQRYGLTIRARPEWRLGLGFLRETWPDIFAAFSVLFFMRSGQLMLESMRGAGDVGIYAAATRLSEAWNFIPVSLAASAFPKIVQSRSNTALYYAQISRLMIALGAIAYLAGISATLLSEPLVMMLYGKSYGAAAPVLSIHIWCGLLVGFGTVSGSWLLAERKLMLSLQRSLLGLVVSIALNLILIPPFGPIGAAWSTLIAMTSAYYLFDLVQPSTRHMFRIKTRALFFIRSPG